MKLQCIFFSVDLRQCFPSTLFDSYNIDFKLLLSIFFFHISLFYHFLVIFFL